MSASVFGRFHRLSETLDGGNDRNDNSKDTSFDPHVMSEEEIMHKYWKISVSKYVFVCMISLILHNNHLWNSNYIMFI